MRGFLNKALPLHADFDAFCIDYFGDLRRRFGGDWDLVSKQNLLLTAVPAERLLAALEADFASDGALLRQLSELRRHLSPDEQQRQRHSAELEQLCEARALRLATGGATQDLDPRIRELKQQLRRLPQLQDGEILGERYKLLSLLGKGGFARVYQAYDLLSKSLVAVKVLHSESSDDQRSLSRFERGARQMAQLSHPHIVRVLGEPAEQDGFHYFVMEYLGGGDLDRAVKAGVLSRVDKLRVVMEVGSALRAAHQRQLIHRDVKPENILLDEKLHAKLTDFDLVWAADTTGGTRSRAGLGTYLYAAPEQLIDASRVSFSADIYGLAVLTIFILRGNLPTWFRDYRSGTIDRLPIHQAFLSLLDRATHASPEYRPSLDEFLRTAATHWPFEPEDQVTTKPMALPLQELEVSTLKVERTEADGSSSAKPVAAPAELPKTILAAVHPAASLPVAPPASGSTLDPVTTDHGGALHVRSLRITVVALVALVAVGLYFGTARQGKMDPSTGAALLNLGDDLEQPPQQRSEAVDMTTTLLPNSTTVTKEVAVSKPEPPKRATGVPRPTKPRPPRQSSRTVEPKSDSE